MESGFGQDSPRLLSPPAPEKCNVVRMRTHLTNLVKMKRVRSLERRIAEWSRDLVGTPRDLCRRLLLSDTM